MSTYLKLFLQTFGIFFITLVAGGYLYLTTINELYDEKVKLRLASDKEKIISYIQNIEKEVTKNTLALAENNKVIESLSLLNKVQSKEIYDATLKQLLIHTDRVLSNKDSSLIILFNDTGYSLIKNGTQFHTYFRGYTISENGKKYFIDKNKTPLIEESIFTQSKCLTRLNSNFQDNQLGFCFTHEILNEKKVVGYVKTAYFLGVNDLLLLNKTLNYPIYFDAGKDKIIQTNIQTNKNNKIVDSLVYDGNTKLYANHIIDQTIINHQRNLLYIKFLAICIIALFLSLFVSQQATKSLFLNPLLHLRKSIKAIKNHENYDEIISENNELSKIAEEFNNLFKELLDTTSYNSAYIKSINGTNLVSKTNLKGIITYTNESFEKTSGYTHDELIGKPHSIVRHPDMPKEAFKNLWETIEDGQVWRGIVKNKTKDGGYYWTDAVITPVTNKYGETIEYLSIRRDITELIDQKKQLLDMVNFDSLTSLASRTRLDSDLKNCKNPALALINIDGFSQINDFYGHHFGDAALQEFAKRLQKITKILCKSGDIYRQNGDEFVILCDTTDKENFIVIIGEILKELEEKTFTINDEKIDLTMSCGISFENSSSIRLTADMALRISRNKKENFIVYNDQISLNTLYEKNIFWAKKIKNAIANDKIVPFFQPIVNNKTNKYEKYEALVRMIGEDGKVISPYFFLDIAKKTKQYIQLTTIMLEKTFETFSNREEEFSINITMEDIVNKSINELILSLLLRYDGIGERVVFEIVESESIDGNYEEVLSFVEKVKSYGCKIAIDDFGSGYSNFEYLIKLKADFIKIDGSLIKDIHENKESYAVVSVIVSFAKQMNIKTIAEFVEDENILKTLKFLGVEYSQGYYFSAPVQTLPKEIL
jgi:diguanylate cyclase (GGDEF)-like protein/PAS domain S-box-containing protein